MNRLVLAVGGVLALLPAVASAALRIQIGPKWGAGLPNRDLIALQAGEYFFDLVFQGDTVEGRPANEALFAYDLLITAPQGVNLVRAEKPDNWVFAAPDAVFAQAEADPRHILVNGINSLDPTAPPGSDITTGKKVARVFFTVDPAEVRGFYPIFLDPNTTTFGSGDPEQELVIPVNIDDPGAVWVAPEPSGLALLGVAGALALRRRR